MTVDADVKDASDLAALAREARWQVIKSVTGSKAGHIGGPLSMMELLVTLYFEALHIRPDEPDWADRDRFILSKGHAAIGLYAVLALRGYLPVDELATFDKAGSRLQGHPDVTKLPGLDSSTGSLGQGLSFGVGVALGAVVTAVGNDSPAEKSGVLEIDGHDFDQIRNAYALARRGDSRGRPTVIIAQTLKGKGLSLAEGTYKWHSTVPTPEEYAQAQRELDAAYTDAAYADTTDAETELTSGAQA